MDMKSDVDAIRTVQCLLCFTVRSVANNKCQVSRLKNVSSIAGIPVCKRFSCRILFCSYWCFPSETDYLRYVFMSPL